MKSKKKAVQILLVAAIIYILISLIISKSLSVISPSLIFNNEYKEINLNEINHTVSLDQFSAEGDKLTSVSYDPKYDIWFDEPQNITSISFKVSELSKYYTPMQIYLYAPGEETPIQVTSILVKGINIIKLGPNTGNYSRVRLDFVTEPNISFKVNENDIKFNGAFPFKFQISILIILLIGNIYLFNYLFNNYGESLNNATNKLIENVKQQNFARDLTDFFQGFYKFIINNKYIIYSGILLFLVCFLYEATNVTISVDEENAIRAFDGKGWIGQGRYGIVLFNMIFSLNNKFSVALSSLTADMIVVFTGMMFTYIINRLTRNQQSKISYVVAMALFVSFPYVNVSYLSFSMYSVPVSLGTLFAIISFGYVGQGYKSYMLAVIPLTLALSVYQSFVAVFILGTVIWATLLVVNDDITDVKGLFNNLIKFIIVFLVSVVTYLITVKISRVVFGVPKSEYMDYFMAFSTYSISNVMRIIQVQMYKLFLNDSNRFYSIIMFLLYAIVILKTIISTKYETQKKYMLVFLLVALVFAPYIHTIILNAYLPARALQAIPILVGIMWFININYVSNNKIIKGLVIAVAVFAINNQVLEMNRLFYAEEFRYTKDLEFANDLIDEIIEVNNGYIDKPISIIGLLNEGEYMYAFYNTYLEETYETIGKPLVTHDGNKRIGSFLNAIGYRVDISQYSGDEKFADVPNWPSKDAIFIRDGVIYVKLGDI